MIIYSGALIWVILLYIYNNNGIIALDERQYPNKVEVFLSMFYLVFFIGLRSAGADTAAYIRGYNNAPTGFDTALRTLLNYRKEETLFAAFEIVMKTLFGSNYTPYLFAIAAVTGAAVALSLYKYSEGYFTSMILFLQWGTWTWMFNGIGQFLAVSIAMLGLPFIEEEKPIHYIILILVASRIHTSALIMIPMYFLVRGEPWKINTVFAVFGALFAVLFTNQFLRLLGTATEGMEYGEILTNSNFLNDSGSNPIRTILYAIPCLYSFIVRDTIHDEAPRIIKICVNMSIVCVCVSIIANVTSGIYIGRLPVYFSVYNLILLPWLFCHTSIRDDGWIPATMALYTAEYIYEYYIHGHLYYVSEILHLNIR